MSRRYCLICGIVALLAAGCEEGDGSSGGGSNQTPKAKAASPSNNSSTNTKMIVPDPDVFLASPLATPPLRTGTVAASAPGIDLGSITGDNGDPFADIGFTALAGSGPITFVAMDTDHDYSTNTAANPEPVTAMLALMGLGALGIATRRRAA